MARLRSKIGVGAMAIGVALMVVGVFAGGASAQQNSAPTAEAYGATCDPVATFTWGLDPGAGYVEIDQLVDTGTQTISDGSLSVTLSHPVPVDGLPKSWLHIGSLHVETDKPVTSVIVRLWVDLHTYEHVAIDFAPPATSFDIDSEAIFEHEGVAPIKGLAFCYEVEVIDTSTTQAPTTTVEVAPTTVTAAPTTVTEAPDVIGVEVLPQVVTAPEAQAQPQLAFSGAQSTSYVLLGSGLLLVGLLLVGVDKLGLIRRGEHSR